MKTSLFQFLTWTHFSFMCWAWFKTENNEKQPTNLKEKNNKSNNHHTRSVSIFKSIRCDYCCLTSNNHHTRSVSIFKNIRCDYCCLTSNNHHTRSVSIFKNIRCDYCCLTSNNHHTRSVSIFKSIRCDYCCLTSNNHHTRSVSIFKSIRLLLFNKSSSHFLSFFLNKPLMTSFYMN